MSNLTYNPNVNIPYHSNFSNSNSNYSNSNYSNSNFSNSKYNKYEYDNYDDNFEMDDNQYGRQQINPRDEMPMKSSRSMKKRKQTFKNKYTEEMDETDVETKDNKIVWSLIFKKIVIITALFLLISHIKTDEIMCKFIPYLSENQLICMTLKGIILSILIIILQLLLK